MLCAHLSCRLEHLIQPYVLLGRCQEKVRLDTLRVVQGDLLRNEVVFIVIVASDVALGPDNELYAVGLRISF